MSLVVVDGFELVRADDPEVQFQAGSVSKSVAAFTALRLVDAGKVDLDEDVNDRLVSWQIPDGDGVTLRRLLTHTAGIGVPFCPGYGDETEVPTHLQVLDGVPPAVTDPVRVETAPGSGFRYSGGGYALVQLLLEDVSGKPFGAAPPASSPPSTDRPKAAGRSSRGPRAARHRTSSSRSWPSPTSTAGQG